MNEQCYVHETLYSNVNQWTIVPTYLKEHDSFVNKEGQNTFVFNEKLSWIKDNVSVQDSSPETKSRYQTTTSSHYYI